MAPSEGDRSNRFAEFSRKPDRMTDTGSSDESDCTKAKKVITKDTSRDVSSSTSAAPSPSSPNCNSNANTTSTISPKIVSRKTPVRKAPTKKHPPEQNSTTEQKSSWGSDSSDEVPNATPVAISKQTSKTSFTNNSEQSTATTNTPYTTSPTILPPSPNSNSTTTPNDDAWEGTIVNGKKTPQKSNITTAAKRQETAQAETATSPKDHSAPMDTKSPSICGAYGSLRDIREGAVKYERILQNNAPYNPINEAKGIFRAILDSDPKAFFVSMNDPELKIMDPSQVPATAKDLEAFFESSMTRATDNTKYIFSFKIRSQLTLQSLKETNNRSLLEYLKHAHASLTEHRFESLSTEKIGWFSMKTTYLSLEGFREALCYELLEPTASSQHRELKDLQIPPFEVVVARVSETSDKGGNSEGVLAISCQESDSEAVRKLFSQQSLDSDRYGAFVLFATRKSNPAMHNNMVSRHRKFVRATQVVQTAGLSWSLLCSDAIDPIDNTQKMLLDVIIKSNIDILAIDESKHDPTGQTNFGFTVPREFKPYLNSYLANELPKLAALSAEFDGQAVTIVERERNAYSMNAEKLAEKFPTMNSSPQRNQPQRRQQQIRETTSFQWSNIQQFPLLPQSPPKSPPTLRTYKQAATAPLPKHNPLVGLSSLSMKSTKNRNTRNYQTLTSLNPVPEAARQGTRVQSNQAPLNSSFEIDMDTITLGGTLADESIAASIQSVLTEFSLKLQRSEEVIKLQESFVRDAALALQAQKAQTEELKSQTSNLTLNVEKRAEMAEKALQEQSATIQTSIDTLLERDRRRDNELLETKAHLGELQASVSEKIDNQRNNFQCSQDVLADKLMSSQRAQTDALLQALRLDLVPMRQSIALLQLDKEQAQPEAATAPTTPLPANPVSSVHVTSITSMSTLTCPTSGRTTTLPDTQPLQAISENEPQEQDICPPSATTASTSSSLPLAALGKRMTVATPTVPASASTPSPIVPTKRHKHPPLNMTTPTLPTPPELPPSPDALSVTHTPDTLFDEDASALAKAIHLEEQCQAQLSDPKLDVNDPEVLTFQQHEADDQDQRELDRMTRVDHGTPASNVTGSPTTCDSASNNGVENLSAIANPRSSDPPREGRRTKSPMTLNALTKTLFSTASSSTSATTTSTASATTTTNASPKGQEAPVSVRAGRRPRQQK